MDVTKPEISGVAQFSLNRPSSKNPFIRHWCENRGPQFQWFIRHAHKFPYWNSHFGVYAPFSFDTIIHLPDFTDISRPAFQSEDTGIHGCPSTQKTVYENPPPYCWILLITFKLRFFLTQISAIYPPSNTSFPLRTGLCQTLLLLLLPAMFLSGHLNDGNDMIHYNSHTQAHTNICTMVKLHGINVWSSIPEWEP